LPTKVFLLWLFFRKEPLVINGTGLYRLRALPAALKHCRKFRALTPGKSITHLY